MEISCGVVKKMNITDEHVKLILLNYVNGTEDIFVENYSIQHASENMLGFLSDYWKLEVYLAHNRVLHFFVKSICKSNAAKANMMKELKLFDKELFFYSIVNSGFEVRGLKPWCAKFVMALDDAMVFEDLSALQYKLRNKFDRFDMSHTILALKALARFHASSIIFEEKRSKDIERTYRFNDEYGQFMDKAGYHENCPWFVQCMNGALEATIAYSKYNRNDVNLIKDKWSGVWFSALQLSSYSSKYRNVICHRDLWNNNILFRYGVEDNCDEPNDCLFVDFQAIRYQPPASDFMVLLCCNLDPKFREENLDNFINCYLNEFQTVLYDYDVIIENIMSKQDFISSVEEQRLWGLIVCACLIPQFWIDENLTAEIFRDTEKFDDILSKNKGMFIKKMMHTYPDYKEKVLEIFEEIANRYCL